MKKIRNYSGKSYFILVCFCCLVAQIVLEMLVTPTWWRHWIEYLTESLLFLAALYVVRRYELHRIRLKNQLELEKVEADALRNLEQLRSHFFANISHEFRTPLTLIIGQLESVMSTGIESGENSKLKVAAANAQRLLTLINQILDLARLESGSMELIGSQHNIVSFLKGHFYAFSLWADSQKITMHFGSDSDDIQMVFDPDKMETIFNNLVSNALKFTGEGGEVSVSLQVVDSRFLEILVKDDGACIPAGQLPHIFDRFYQAGTNSHRNQEGTGIGLALARELVGLHHGKITASSSENEGTVFTVTIPLGELTPGEGAVEIPASIHTVPHSYSAVYEMKGAESADPPVQEDGSGQECILVLEDNDEVRTYIREQLEVSYLVREAGNGEEGLAMAQIIIPDLIITDVLMPEMDGYKFCSEIRKDERTSHIPVIMLTAKAGFDDRMEGLATGADDYLVKPFSTRELKIRVGNLIGQRRLLRSRFSQATGIKPSDVTASPVDRLFLEKIMGAIETNIENPYFTVELLANEVHMSISQLNRKLNALIGQPAGQMIRSLRLQRAAELLAKRSGTVTQIGYKLGFNDQAYFSRAFKKQFGRSPSEYMNG